MACLTIEDPEKPVLVGGEETKSYNHLANCFQKLVLPEPCKEHLHCAWFCAADQRISCSL